MNFLRPAIRYLWITRKESRPFKKTGWSILSIALSIATLVVVMSIMMGFEEMFTQKLIGIDGQLTIDGFLDKRNDDDTLALLDKTVGQDNVSPITESQAVLTVGNQVTLVMATGIIPAREAKFTQKMPITITGNRIMDDSHAVIGKEIAKKYGLKVGGSLSLMSPLTGQEKTLIITGIFETGLYHVDASTIMMDITTARNLFDIRNPFTSFKVNPSRAFKDRFQLKAALSDKLVPYYRILTWDEKNRSLLEALHLERVMMTLVLSMMVILAGFNMSSTLTILTIEKRYEIGVLKTLGFSQREITWIFVLKAMIWGSIGALVGVVGGILIALNAHDLVKMIEPIFGLHIVSGEGLYFKEIPVSIEPKSIILIVLFSLMVTLFSALIPSRRAAKQDAVEVLSS